MDQFEKILQDILWEPDSTNTETVWEQLLLPTGATYSRYKASCTKCRQQLLSGGYLEQAKKLINKELTWVDSAQDRIELLLAQAEIVADLGQFDVAIDFLEKAEDVDREEMTAGIKQTLIDQKSGWKKNGKRDSKLADAADDAASASSLYLQAAKTHIRFAGKKSQAEKFLTQAVENEPDNLSALGQLERLYRSESRWERWYELLQRRMLIRSGTGDRLGANSGKGSGNNTRVYADVSAMARLICVATHLDKMSEAKRVAQELLALEPRHPVALRVLLPEWQQAEDWETIAEKLGKATNNVVYPSSVEVEFLVVCGQVLAYRLDNMDAANGCFRKVRAVKPEHPEVVAFYRKLYTDRQEYGKLMLVLQHADKAMHKASGHPNDALTEEMATIAETHLSNPTKAAEIWKSLLRRDPSKEQVRSRLRDLYAKTQKWNALLDVEKESLDRLSQEDANGQVAILFRIAAIYRDHLKLAVMVSNAYQQILKIDPRNEEATQALVAHYENTGRWNDLISLLSRKAADETAPIDERVALYRQVSGLWVEKFGNHSQAIAPLKSLLALQSDDKLAIDQLKEIFTRRRQWKALLGLMELETAQLSVEHRAGHLAAMAEIATQRLGKSSVAIELWNQVLENVNIAGGSEHQEEAHRHLAGLYNREKRYLCLAEILRRTIVSGSAEEVPLLERLVALWVDRIKKPSGALFACTELLRLNPKHLRARRTLRDIYAHRGDLQALETLYGEGSGGARWGELVDTLHGLAERESDKKEKVRLLLFSAQVAQDHSLGDDKIQRCFERVLSVVPDHSSAAESLVRLYEKQENWPRLVAVYEVIVGSEPSEDRRNQLLERLKELCEHKLASFLLAFQWAEKRYVAHPSRDTLKELLRLAEAADRYEDAALAIETAVKKEDNVDAKVVLWRQLGEVVQEKLQQPDRARQYYENILACDPTDSSAIEKLEEIASDLAEWPALLEVYRRKVSLEKQPIEKAELLLQIAFIEEKRLGDMDAAQKTYCNVLEHNPAAPKAYRALCRIYEEKSEWDALIEVLHNQLSYVEGTDAKVEIYQKVGFIRHANLGDAAKAFSSYAKAFDLAPERVQTQTALQEFLSSPDSEVQIECAQRLVDIFDRNGDHERLAESLQILLTAADTPQDRHAQSRRLLVVYGDKLDRKEQAFDLAVELYRESPQEDSVRDTLLRYAEELGKNAVVVELLSQSIAERSEQMEPLELANLCRLVAKCSQKRPEKALQAWRKLLSIDPSDSDAYLALEKIYLSRGDKRALQKLLTQWEVHAPDTQARVTTLEKQIAMYEQFGGSTSEQRAVYERVLEVAPQHEVANGALEAIYEQAKEYDKLSDLLSRQLDFIEDPCGQADVLYRRAKIAMDLQRDTLSALSMAEEILVIAPGHLGARSLLEKLLDVAEWKVRAAMVLESRYQEDDNWDGLLRVLAIQHEEQGTTDTAEYLSKIASLQERKTGEIGTAYRTWLRAFRAAPGDPVIRDSVKRLASKQLAWEEAAQCYEQATRMVADTDTQLLVELLSELAEIYDGNLMDTEKSVSAYERLFAIDRNNPDIVGKAAVELDRIYAEEGKHRELAEILRVRTLWAESSEDRVVLLKRSASLQAESLGDVDAAIVLWEEVLAESPDDSESLTSLESLYIEQARFIDVADLLQRKIDVTTNATEKFEIRCQLAEVLEHKLGNFSEAIVTWSEIVDQRPKDAGALRELARLYEREHRNIDVFVTLEKLQECIEEPKELLRLDLRIADLLAGSLGREREALERYQSVLSQYPDNKLALDAVLALSKDSNVQEEASNLLVPIYRQKKQFGLLAELLTQKAAAQDNMREKIQLLSQTAAIYESHLNDEPSAFVLYCQMARAAKAEPEVESVLADVERLGRRLSLYREMREVFVDVADDVFDAGLQRQLCIAIAELAMAEGDTNLAKQYYHRMLESSPEDELSLERLESLYREFGDHKELLEILRQKLVLTDNATQKLALMRDCAQICARIGDSAEAVVLWEEVLSLEKGDSAAIAALTELYPELGQYHDLGELWEKQLSFLPHPVDRIVVREKLAQLYTGELDQPDRAVTHYEAILAAQTGKGDRAKVLSSLEELAHDDRVRREVVAVLEPAYVAQGDWPKLAAVYEAKLEGITEPEKRAGLHADIGRLYEEQLEELAVAFGWYDKSFRENPTDQMADQLYRLANVLSNWRALSEVYQHYVVDSYEREGLYRKVSERLAEIYDHRLEQPANAAPVYTLMLEETPEDHALRRKLAAIQLRLREYDKVVRLHEDGLEFATDPQEKKRYYRALVDIEKSQQQHFGNSPQRSIEHLQQLLDLDPQDDGTAAELRLLLEGEELWFELADFLAQRLAANISPAIRDELQLHLADLLLEKLQDEVTAIDHYEQLLLSKTREGQALHRLETLVIGSDYRERVIAILEGYYRDHDQWKKLAVILEAKVQYLADAGDKTEDTIASYKEIARLHETRGGSREQAFSALESAWKQDPSRDDVYEQLAELADKYSYWDALADALQSTVASTYNQELGATLHARLAEIHEEKRRDTSAAVAAWQGVLDCKEDDDIALSSLDRLLTQLSRFDALTEVLERRIELCYDEDTKRKLLTRYGEILEKECKDPERAMDVFRALVELDDTNTVAWDTLARLYEEREMWPELLEVLQRRIHAAPEDQVSHWIWEAAQMCETKLKDPYEAIAFYGQLLTRDPGHEKTLAALSVLYEKQEMWIELLEVLDRRSQLTSSPKVDELFAGAVVAQDKLQDWEQAATRFGHVLSVDPRHEAAKTALMNLISQPEAAVSASRILEPLLLAGKDTAGLLRLYHQQLETMDEPSEYIEAASKLAKVYESQGDIASTQKVWLSSVSRHGYSEEIQKELLQSTKASGNWLDYTRALEEQLAECMDGDWEEKLATMLAEAYEVPLGDAAKATTYWERVADISVDPAHSLRRLDAIYSQGGDSAKLRDILIKRREMASNANEKLELYTRLGNLYQTELGDVDSALQTYQDALFESENDATIVGVLQSLLVTAKDSQKSTVIDILEPIYYRQSDFSSWLELQTAKLQIIKDSHQRADIYKRATEVAEEKASDTMRAFDLAGGWLESDSTSEEALHKVTDLAARSQRWQEAVARLSGVAESLPHEEDRVPLMTTVACWQRDHLQDVKAAIKTYGSLWKKDANREFVVAPLASLYDAQGMQKEKSELLLEAAADTFDTEKKVQWLTEVATIQTDLGDKKQAAHVWEQVAECGGDQVASAITERIKLLEQLGEWEQVALALETLIEDQSVGSSKESTKGSKTANRGTASLSQDRRRLLVRLATVCQTQLADLDRAAEYWQAASDIAPPDIEIYGSLERAHRKRKDWVAVHDVLLEKRKMAVSRQEQLQVLLQLAELSLHERQSKNDAIDYWLEIIDIDPVHPVAGPALETALASQNKWHEWIEILEKQAKWYKKQGSTADEIACLAKAVDVWEGPLDDPEAARSLLETLLQRDAAYVPALTRLAKLHERDGRWDDCVAILQKALELKPKGVAAADLYFRLAHITKEHQKDSKQSVRYAQIALQHQPTHIGAIEHIESCARDNEDWQTVATMLAKRADLTTDTESKVPLVLDCVRLYTRKLNDPQTATKMLEGYAASVMTPGMTPGMASDKATVSGEPSSMPPAIAVELAEIYTANAQWKKAEPLLLQLRDHARAKRDMKSVANYAMRLGKLFRSRGDEQKALQFLEESFRAAPTNVETLLGVGELYVAQKKWEKARRVYRSLVLQNIDAKLGVTKADVYYQLGEVHKQLGEPQKAKGMFQRGLEVEPQNTLLQKAIEQLVSNG